VAGRAGWFRARVWLFDDGAPQELLQGERLVEKSSFDKLLYDLIDDVEGRGFKPEAVDLAFLLPRNLLAEEIDQWCPTPEDLCEEPPIGATFRVTVRPLYTRKSRARRRWERAWERWKASAGEHVALPVALGVALGVAGGVADGVVSAGSVAGPAGGDAARAIWLDDELVADPLVLNRLRADDLALGLLPSPPSARPAAAGGGRTADALDLALQAGLPVLLWARSPLADDPAKTIEILRELLSGTPAGELPAELYRRRCAAVAAAGKDGGEAALRSSLALVWDDPERLPPTLDPENRLGLTVETV
jgi:hypothetical protein